MKFLGFVMAFICMVMVVIFSHLIEIMFGYMGELFFLAAAVLVLDTIICIIAWISDF